MKQPQGNANLYASFPVQLLTAGTSACVADLATFPLDTAKVRLQIQGEGRAVAKVLSAAAIPAGNGAILAEATVATGPAHVYRGLVGTVSTIVKQEGPKALYNGLSAGLQRQMCFASVRLGMYDTVKGAYQSVIHENPEGLQIFTRIMAGLTTGGLAVAFAQPTDVVKVRYQAQNKANLRYTSTFNAYRVIGREEGIKGLWKGAMPNIGRNAIVNVAEIVCYDVIKDCLLKYTAMGDNIPCHFTAAVIAGFVTTLCASPVDVVKTRYMNSKPGQYSGAIDCAVRMGRQEGFSAFYKGFLPSFARLVSWNIVLWITYEQMKKAFYKRREEL